ncbi:MAG: VOC family protein [Miltoncostaeaceae bacterium]
MSFHAYLFFGGNCREAMTRYREVFGGELEVMGFSDAPPEARPEGDAAAGVMHAALKMPDGGVLMASDDPTGGFTGHSGFGVARTADDPEETRRAFAALAEGGQVQMPVEATFWSPAFGMLVDAFGVSWMLDTNPAED